MNLLTIGISCHNMKAQVPNDVATHNQIVNPNHLKSQETLNLINEWTKKNKMKINKEKTKTVIFNFTQNYQFTSRLALDAENVENVSEAKLLGTIIQSDMKWDSNTSNIVRRANARMILLRKLAEFSAPKEDLKTIYISYIRSILEQSAVVWHTSLTESNREDLERVQRLHQKLY